MVPIVAVPPLNTRLWRIDARLFGDPNPTLADDRGSYSCGGRIRRSRIYPKQEGHLVAARQPAGNKAKESRLLTARPATSDTFVLAVTLNPVAVLQLLPCSFAGTAIGTLNATNLGPLSGYRVWRIQPLRT
jgi:hypothetical protein